MLCPKCNSKMVALFYTQQCDVCNPPASVAETSTKRGTEYMYYTFIGKNKNLDNKTWGVRLLEKCDAVRAIDKVNNNIHEVFSSKKLDFGGEDTYYMIAAFQPDYVVSSSHEGLEVEVLRLGKIVDTND